MIKVLVPCIVMLLSFYTMAKSVTYSCEQKYTVNINASGHAGTVKIYKDGKPVAITSSDKFFIDLESHAYDMNGDTVFNYAAYKGYDHTIESIPVSDFYTLITKNSTLDSPAKVAKLKVVLSSNAMDKILNCSLGLDLSGIDFN